jgi:hypothetical protein
MYTITLSQEDFKEEAHWIALCDSLDMPNTLKELTLSVVVVGCVEPD